DTGSPVCPAAAAGHDARRIPNHGHFRLDVAYDDASDTHDGAGADHDAVADDSSGAHVTTGSESRSAADQGAGGEGGAIADDGIVRNSAMRRYQHVIPHAGAVAHERK